MANIIHVATPGVGNTCNQIYRAPESIKLVNGGYSNPVDPRKMCSSIFSKTEASDSQAKKNEGEGNIYEILYSIISEK